MKKIIVIGCPGSGKTTFSLKLAEKIKLPLFHLDAIWHKPDRTHITREEFDICDYAGCTRRELQSLVDSVIARKKMKIAATAVN